MAGSTFHAAVDFGFSKDYRETLRIWDKQQVLSDIVRVIREFRPDVVITRFSPVPGGTHGHHTASTVLAMEAFKVCRRSQRVSRSAPRRAEPVATQTPSLEHGRIPAGGKRVQRRSGSMSAAKIPCPASRSAEIAARSRSMHKTQGFGNFTGFGGGNGPRSESFALLDGEPATKAGTSWTA